MSKYDTICLSGGGIKGICMIGAFKKLKENNIINFQEIKKYIGTSIGSIICFLLILSYTPYELIDFVLHLNFKKLESDIDCELLFENYGIDDGTKVISVIQTLLYDKLECYNITFKELYQKTNKEFTIIATNYTTKEESEFSYKKTPDLSVILAIRMSIAIPLVFTPVEYERNIYIDGGITNNFPINYGNIDKTLGICITTSSGPNIKSLTDYILGIMSMVSNSITTKHDFNEKNTIIINVDDNKPMSFDIGKDEKNYYVEIGIKSAELFCHHDTEIFVKGLVNEIIKKVCRKVNSEEK